jgi:hypothetical protein
LIVTSNAQQCKGQVEIDINNDEPLQTIWEYMSKIRRGHGGWGYYSIDKPQSPLPLFLSLSHIFKVKLKFKFKYLFNH